ncbi:ATP synthase F1 subunit epsilon [Gaoshiqia sp. Z1-71]|uniref:ATP synthase F1 subunit epsilon n=1 Tax=Gaoshiqia hydrogeniformans TaxID=3290090 RepID=UPI003BF8058A
MYLEIITPVKKVFSGEVKLVQLPGTKGSFEILTNHAPIISTLEKGRIKIVDQGDQVSFIEIAGGVVESKSNKISILAESV